VTSRTTNQLQRATLGVAVAVAVLAVLLVVAVYSDDREINAHQGSVVADVLNVGARRAAISFTTPDGVTHSPPLGVSYPTGLTAGQRIDVQYSTNNPDIVRVAGRGWTLALAPAGSVVAVTWLLAGVALYLCRRARAHREREAALPLS